MSAWRKELRGCGGGTYMRRVEGCTHWMEGCTHWMEGAHIGWRMKKVCEMEDVLDGGCGDQWRKEWRWWWVRDTCGGSVHRMFSDGECMKLYRGVGWRCMGC